MLDHRTYVQEELGLEVASLMEDPQSTSVIAAEAFAKLASGVAGPRAAAEMRSVWISPAPVTVKLRLFCLPYAGGISENVYSRCVCWAISRVQQSSMLLPCQQSAALVSCFGSRVQLLGHGLQAKHTVPHSYRIWSYSPLVYEFH